MILTCISSAPASRSRAVCPADGQPHQAQQARQYPPGAREEEEGRQGAHIVLRACGARLYRCDLGTSPLGVFESDFGPSPICGGACSSEVHQTLSCALDVMQLLKLLSDESQDSSLTWVWISETLRYATFQIRFEFSNMVSNLQPK